MRHVMITGGSSGIGGGLAKRLTGEVERLSLVSRNGDGSLTRMKERLDARGSRTKVDAYDVDVNDLPASIETVRAAWARQPVDVFVSCAGGSHVYGLFEEMSHEDIDAIVRTNCLSVLHWLRELLPRMREGANGAWKDKRAHVVLLSSRSGERTLPRLSAYTVAKGGVEKIAETMQKEYARHGIVFTLVNPGSINTAFTDRWNPETREAHNAESMGIDFVLDPILFAIRGDVAVNRISLESVTQWKAELGVIR